MDYRKNMNTPRDMIDDDMLVRLIEDYEPVAAAFGNVRRENRRRQNNNSGSGCGCGNGNGNGNENCSNVRSASDDNGTSMRHHRGTESGQRNTRDSRDSGTVREEQDWNRVRGESDCLCNESCANDDKMKNFPLAMAYVPMQEWEDIYDDETALNRGTLFEQLDLPWYQSACECGSVGGTGTCRKCSDHR